MKGLDANVPGTVETATSRAPRPFGPRMMRRSDFPEPESCCNNPPSRILPPKFLPHKSVSGPISTSQHHALGLETEFPVA